MENQSSETGNGLLYTSKKFCEITGITAETLRHYLELGLIKPAAVTESKYRKFSIENAVDVFYLRHERGLGLRLNQLQCENEAETLSEQEKRYQNNLDELMRQKALLESQIERNVYYQKLIQRAVDRKGEPLFINAMQLFGLSFLEFSDAKLANPQAVAAIRQWMNHPELLHLALRIELDQLLSEQPFLTPRIGLGIRTDFAEKAGLRLDEAVTSQGSGKIADLVARSESLTCIPKAALQPLYEIARQSPGCHDVLVGRMITRVKEKGQYWYYCSYSLDLGETA